ncbi:Transmembrane 4 L6 family member 19 [Tupaia chinensis]|uniref:Transmembrane 4 L6 family member 19 n=1 Tax=Tupaia chinensis TaxID=246437 RepID=L9JKB9_TUPCH|nr:Transmembrane 4 L6 family member 19 [Tupaia chinensis]
MLSSLCMMTCPRTCTRILGLSLGTAALFAAGANMALLFPDWDVTYLWRGLIGRHAMLGTGFWGGGIMVLTAAALISLMGWRYSCFSESGPCRSRFVDVWNNATTSDCSLDERVQFLISTNSKMLTALLSSGLALLGALICFVTSGVALKDGPFCKFDVSSFNQTQAWKYGYPFKDLRNRNYLYDHSLWTSVCLEPSKAVVWHVSFFSALLCVSLLQLLLVAIHFINSFLSLFCSLCEK